MLHFIIVGLLVLIAAGTRINFVAHRNMAEHSGMAWPGARALFVDGCPWFTSAPGPAAPVPVPVPAVASATTSGFASTDFMAHAKAMDARKMNTTNPAKKMEALMASSDQSARKLRSTLIRGG